MSAPADIMELACPACGGRVSARWEQIGDPVECPLCRQRFEVPPPEPEVPPSAPVGRIFHFQCLRCGSVLEARSGQSGRSGKCPTCAAVFTVPAMDPRTGLARTNADPGSDGENPTPVHAYAAAGGMAPKLIRQPDDSLVIECPRCRRHAPVTADNCRGCGLPFTMEGVSARAVTASSSRGQTAAALAVVGLFLSFCGGVGVIFGLLAVVYGGAALLDSKNTNRLGALIGVALGVVDCLISIAILANL